MRKFFVLLRKETKELFTVQMLIPIVLMAAIFMLLGSLMNDAIQEEGDGANLGKIVVLDLDNSELSRESIKMLNTNGFDVTTKNQGEISAVIEDAKGISAEAILVIPDKFEENILAGTPRKIDSYSVLKSLSITDYTGDMLLQSAVSMINNNISNKLIMEKLENADPEVVKNPVVQNDFVIINDKTANISALEIKSFLTTQNVFIPIVMFMIIIYSSQLLITTIASEKENKTMEALLSTPVTRSAIIGAKMLAAGISALVYALVYMFGFQYYMGGIMGDTASGASEQLKTAVEQLGLTMGAGEYILLGMSLFFSILVALALASILGAMADDAKKAQGFITPVMLLVMVPYLLTMFIDMNTAQPFIRLLVNAIPFSHPFQASSFLFLKQYLPVALGILYQLLVFGVLLFIATKIYSSDRIFMTRHSSKKRKIKLRKI